MDWLKPIIFIYKAVRAAVNWVKDFESVRGFLSKEFEITEIKENLQSGELELGKTIKVIGTFSEYLPFINPATFMGKELPIQSPRTCRINPIDEMYCGALYSPDQIDASAVNVIPIFYDIESPMHNHSTGEMLELECKITPIPPAYSNIIQNRESFRYQRSDGTDLFFGLKVLRADVYGLVGSFNVNTWLIGHNEPRPSLERGKRKTCLRCANSFFYSPIDPFDFPPKMACGMRAEGMPQVIKEDTEDFIKLEKSDIPYLIFVEPYYLFEIRDPKVDIFNEEEYRYSRHLLYAAITKNMKEMLNTHILGSKELPKVNTVKIDYQYDQKSLILPQSFNVNEDILKRIPVWKCPHYVPKPLKPKAG